MKPTAIEKEGSCDNCSKLTPGGVILVDDVKNPHCIYCGREIKYETYSY